MKKSVIILCFSLVQFVALGQTPNAFNYQAVLRDVTGNVLANQEVSLQISIINDSVDGTILYQENHFSNTNQFGFVNLKIGKGIVNNGSFNLIDWSSTTHFLQIAVDNTGGTNFTVIGTSQLLSVPYALYAEDVRNKNDADADSTNELQVISISNDTIYLTNGGFAKLPLDQTKDADADSTNEIQQIWLSNDTIYLTHGGFIKLPSTNISPLRIILTKIDVSGCAGDLTGSIDAEITGGTSPYTIEWSNGSTSATLTDLRAGNYEISVSDSEGQIAVNSITILEPTPVGIVLVNTTPESAASSGDGSIDISASGGTTPYSFQWSNGDITEDLLNVSYGQYSLSVADANQCNAVFNAYIPLLGSITDYEGNEYETIQLGDQVWMRENVRSTKYSDGYDLTTDVIIDQDSLEYAFINPPNVESEGRLYHQVYAHRGNIQITVNQGICPAEWHLPIADEWDSLELFNQTNGLDVKEMLNINYPGYYMSPTIIDYGVACRIASGHYWLTAFDKDKPGYYYITYNPYPFEYNLNFGYFSVRCIKD